jgi:selenobiotic family peptide radical SAM maturase
VRRLSADHLNIIYLHCRRTLGIDAWGRVQAALDPDLVPQRFPDALASLQDQLDLPDIIGDLARIEWAWDQARKDQTPLDPPRDTVIVNPSLNLVPVGWRHLAVIITADPAADLPSPKPASLHVMLWRHPKTGKVLMREADERDLLALKIIVEGIDPRQAARMGGVNVGMIHEIQEQAVDQGILISPGSKIQRAGVSYQRFTQAEDPFLTADTFTLQWHVTQACDLHCRHCYDRSERTAMPFDAALAVLDDFYDFCCKMHVDGQVTFTGGNPLLYPRFRDLYAAAADLGFGLAILGNPASIQPIESLLEIARPSYFQVSLEGLAEYNDYVRGPGHFQRSLEFLDQLRKLEIFTMVMLTLTRDNMDQVLSLGRLLEGRVDAFNFNRLSAVGQGAQLAMPSEADFERFLREYEVAARHNPILGLKDNLINIIRREKSMAPFGGCTGYGCGAAFNFLALLPDGEVHACRKFPSLIGSIYQIPLLDIYHSPAAQRYRVGSSACRDCGLNQVCRGCLAVSYSRGLSIFEDKDPFCFAQKTKFLSMSPELLRNPTHKIK